MMGKTAGVVIIALNIISGALYSKTTKGSQMIHKGSCLIYIYAFLYAEIFRRVARVHIYIYTHTCII